MPLVVPGVASTNSGGDARIEEWTNKLVGKKLSDEAATETTFCKKDLPEKCRVIGPNSVITMEFRTDRLNVYVMEDGVVSRVNYG